MWEPNILSKYGSVQNLRRGEQRSELAPSKWWLDKKPMKGLQNHLQKWHNLTCIMMDWLNELYIMTSVIFDDG